MTGGTESSEAEVKPTKEVVEASPEKVVEVSEAAEVQQATDKAAVSPAAVVEQGDPQAAENLVEAIKAAVPPPEQAAESSAAAREVQSVVSEVSTAAPAITLEGSGAEGKVTITEAAESVAIIDSNDGSSTVNTGPDMSDVAIIDSNDREVIIDSNDGSSTVGIIDSNDGISAEAIIDSNDGVNRVADPVKIIDSNDGSAQPAGADLPDPVSPGPPPSPENTDTSEAPGSGTSVDINLIHSEVAGQSGSVEGPPVVVSEIGELSGDDISDGSVLETDLIDDIPVSGELGDPDDLNPVRERPDESPEGQAKAAVEDALEKEEAAEAARNTAERAKEKLDSEMEDMKNAMNDFDSAYEAAVDTGEELESALEDEDIPDSEYSGSAGGDTWTIEDASEETQDLYQEFQDACQDLMDSYEELENAVWSAKYAHDNASKKMDQAAQAEAEAEQAAKAARNAIAAATGEKPPGDTGRQRSDEPEQETNPPAAGDDSDLSPANLTIQEIRDFDPAQAKTDLLLETLLTKVETRVQNTSTTSPETGSGTGVRPGGLEVGSVEQLEEVIPETGKSTPTDESNPEERSSNPGIDKLVEIAAAKAESAAAEVEDIAAKQAEMQDEQEELREGKSTFDDIVIDSPAEDLGLRKITDDLIDEIDSSELSENSDTSIILEEGSLLVGEAVSEDLTSDKDLNLETNTTRTSEVAEDLLDQMKIERAENVEQPENDVEGVDPIGEMWEQIRELERLIDNYTTISVNCRNQVEMLKEIKDSLGSEPIMLTLYFPVKQADGTYEMIPQTKPITATTYDTYINIYQTNLDSMDDLMGDAYRKIQALRNKIKAIKNLYHVPVNSESEIDTDPGESNQSDTPSVELEQKDN